MDHVPSSDTVSHLWKGQWPMHVPLFFKGSVACVVSSVCLTSSPCSLKGQWPMQSAVCVTDIIPMFLEGSVSAQCVWCHPHVPWRVSVSSVCLTSSPCSLKGQCQLGVSDVIPMFLEGSVSAQCVWHHPHVPWRVSGPCSQLCVWLTPPPVHWRVSHPCSQLSAALRSEGRTRRLWPPTVHLYLPGRAASSHPTGSRGGVWWERQPGLHLWLHRHRQCCFCWRQSPDQGHSRHRGGTGQ